MNSAWQSDDKRIARTRNLWQMEKLLYYNLDEYSARGLKMADFKVTELDAEIDFGNLPLSKGHHRVRTAALPA